MESELSTHNSGAVIGRTITVDATHDTALSVADGAKVSVSWAFLSTPFAAIVCDGQPAMLSASRPPTGNPQVLLSPRGRRRSV